MNKELPPSPADTDRDRVAAINEALLISGLRQHELVGEASRLNAQLVREIAEHQEAQRILAEQARLLDLSNDAIIVRDAQNRITYWNHGAEELYGWTREEAIGCDLHALLKTEFERPFEELTGDLRRNKHLTGEVVQITRDGRHIHLLCRWSLDHDPEGQPGAILTTTTDISDRIASELKLRESNHRLQLALEGSRIGMWDFDLPTGMMRVDDSWCRMLGYGPGEVEPSKDLLERFVHPDDLAAVRADMADCVAQRKPLLESEYRNLAKNGEWRWVLARGRFIDFDAEGAPIRAIGTAMDVTPQRIASEGLREAKTAAERANQDLESEMEIEQRLVAQAQAGEHAKSEFLAVMSHEIRTPMNGVLGYAELLASTSLNEEQRSHVDTISSSGEALLRIIDDILDFSRIESTQTQIDEQPFSLREMLAGACSVLAVRAEQKGLFIGAETEDGIPDQVIGDSGRLRQVLVNLAGNALKFTDQGQITIVVRLVDRNEAERLFVEFSVRDTGLGISTDKLEQIFQPFTQADSGIARRYGGAGLGLTISKRLVEMMGGSLRVESREGAGSAFSFSIPLGVADSALLPVPRTPRHAMELHFAQTHPLSILVVDDDSVNLRLIATILRRMGYQPTTAPDGSTALQIYQDQKPNCILLDMQMPGMDGIAVTESVRKMETMAGGSPLCFIVAFTANVLPRDREKCFAAGMNEFLTKPFKTDHLASILTQAHAASCRNSKISTKHGDTQ